VKRQTGNGERKENRVQCATKLHSQNQTVDHTVMWNCPLATSALTITITITEPYMGTNKTASQLSLG